MKYIGMVDFKEEEFETATATTPGEIKNLVKQAGQNTMK